MVLSERQSYLWLRLLKPYSTWRGHEVELYVVGRACSASVFMLAHTSVDPIIAACAGSRPSTLRRGNVGSSQHVAACCWTCGCALAALPASAAIEKETVVGGDSLIVGKSGGNFTL